MRYRDKTLTFEVTYDLEPDILHIESRHFASAWSQHFDLRTLSGNVTRQRQRNQRVKNCLLIVAVVGIVIISIGAMLIGERLANFSPWLLFSLIAGCLAVATFGLLNPWRDEFAGFHSTAGVLVFWIRRASSPEEFETFIGSIKDAINTSRG